METEGSTNTPCRSKRLVTEPSWWFVGGWSINLRGMLSVWLRELTFEGFSRASRKKNLIYIVNEKISSDGREYRDNLFVS